MPTLTSEQRHLLQESGGAPVRLVDAETKREFVLIDAESFDRLQAQAAADDPRDLYPLLHRALQDEGWDDPQMEEYNRR